MQIPGITYPYPYPVYTGTCRPPKSCTPAIFYFIFLEPCRDLHAARVWPLMSDDESMLDEFWRPGPVPLDLSPHRKTVYRRSLKQPGVRCWLTQRLYEAFSAHVPRACPGRTIARRRTNLDRKVRSRAHFPRLRVRSARARAVRARVILHESQPTILQGLE